MITQEPKQNLIESTAQRQCQQEVLIALFRHMSQMITQESHQKSLKSAALQQCQRSTDGSLLTHISNDNAKTPLETIKECGTTIVPIVIMARYWHKYYVLHMRWSRGNPSRNWQGARYYNNANSTDGSILTYNWDDHAETQAELNRECGTMTVLIALMSLYWYTFSMIMQVPSRNRQRAQHSNSTDDFILTSDGFVLTYVYLRQSRENPSKR